MRSLAPWFMLTVGGLFVLFMVLSDSKVTDLISQQKQYVGSIDGEDITYQEYSTTVDNLKNNKNKAVKLLMNLRWIFSEIQVWDALVAQKMMDKK